MGRYQVLARNFTWYFLSVYIIKFYTWVGASWALRGELLNKFTTMIYFKDYKKGYSSVTKITAIGELI